MKKILLSVFVFIMLITGGMITSSATTSVNAESVEPLNEMPIIQIAIEPNVIYDNSDFMDTVYTITNPIQSYEFLVSDTYVDFILNDVTGFSSDTLSNIDCSFDESSTSPYVASIEYYSIGNDTLLKNRLNIYSTGSCYIFYSGSFDVACIDEVKTYYFYGKILIKIVEDSVYSLDYTTKEKVVTYYDIHENLCTKTVTEYEAIINNNLNLTKYARNRIYWKVGEYSTFGNTFVTPNEMPELDNYKNDLSLCYDNTSWIDVDTDYDTEDFCMVINHSSNLNKNEQSILNQLWWLFDIVLLGLIIGAFILYGKIQDETSLQSTVKHIDEFSANVDKIIEAINKPKRKQSKEKSLIRGATFDLLFACQFCETAIKEDYYELATCYDSLHDCYVRMNTFKKNYEKFDIKKITKLLENIRKKTTAPYSLITRTLQNLKKNEEALEKEQQIKETLKEKLKEKAKNNKITAETLERELEEIDFKSSAKIDNKDKNDDDDIVAASIIATKIINDSQED